MYSCKSWQLRAGNEDLDFKAWMARTPDHPPAWTIEPVNRFERLELFEPSSWKCDRIGERN